MQLTSAAISDKLTARWPSLGSTDLTLSDPLTATEEMARIAIVELLLLLWYDDPDSIGEPDDEPRATWDGMLESTHAEKVGAGVAVMWP